MENKEQRIFELEETLKQVDRTVEEAMAEPNVGGRALLSLRWARKLIARSFGQED